MDTQNPYGMDGKSFREVLTLSIAVSLPLMIIFVAVVTGFAIFGDDWVNFLDDQIGEIVAVRATALATAGQEQEAIDTYYAALAVPFDDKWQKTWTYERLGTLLVKLGRMDEAIEAFQACVQLTPEYMHVHARLSDVFQQEERYDQMLASTEDWFVSALQIENILNQGVAKYRRGFALEKLGRADEALSQYQQGYQVDPVSANGYGAAMILWDKGRHEECRALVEEIVGKANELGESQRAAAKIEALLRLKDKLLSEDLD